MKALVHLPGQGGTLVPVTVLCLVAMLQSYVANDIYVPAMVLLAVLLMLLTPVFKLRSFIIVAWPLLVVLVIGCAGAMVHESQDVLRDIAFALLPACIIYIGYWLAKYEYMWPLIMRVIILAAFLLSIVHLSLFILNPALLDQSVDDLRREAGAGNLVVMVGLALALGTPRIARQLILPRFVPFPLIVATVASSVFFYYSRAGIVLIVILTLALRGYLTRFSLRNVLAWMVIGVGVAVALSLSNQWSNNEFLEKLSRSIREVEVFDYGDMRDINLNWRGFETYQALEVFNRGSLWQKLLGHGFGALVDVGFVMDFGRFDEYSARYIPVLHNGYMYLLVKVGIVGVCMYALFFFNILKGVLWAARSFDVDRQLMGRLAVGVIVASVCAMYVVGGMAQAFGPIFILLIGFLVRRVEMERESVQTSTVEQESTCGPLFREAVGPEAPARRFSD